MNEGGHFEEIFVNGEGRLGVIFMNENKKVNKGVHFEAILVYENKKGERRGSFWGDFSVREGSF